VKPVPERFQTTRWSLVLAAAQGGAGSAEALEWLCRTYWYPLYGYIRRRGHDAESARDLTQSFFLHLLEKSALREIDPREGKFRAFLLASLKNFLSNERVRQGALKRRADDSAFRLSLHEAEERYLGERATALGPEEFFQARWARAVLDRVVQRLGDEHESSGKGEVFQRLRNHLTGEEASYDSIAEELGTSAGALRVALHRMRRRLGMLLREEVAHTLSSTEDVDDEIRELLLSAGRKV
jgi:RNA polymerase sigma-70 factor (ECF subfamily)